MVAPESSGYSADVKLELVVGDDRYPLAQVGGGRLVFYQETVLRGNRGEVVVRIDGKVSRSEVIWEASDVGRKVVQAAYRKLTDAVGEAEAKAAGHGA